MMEQVDESGELVERVAALDIGKASVMACIRVPPEDGRRRCQEVREYGTTTGALLALAGHLDRQGFTLVVTEATSDYWKPVFYLLEAGGFTCWLLNAKHVKNVPGRPKTDPLTELPGGVPPGCGRMGFLVAMVADHDHSRRCTPGPVPAGGAAGRVA